MSTFSNDDNWDIGSDSDYTESGVINKLKKQVELLLEQVTEVTNAVNVVTGNLSRHIEDKVTTPGNDVHAVNEKYAGIFSTIASMQRTIAELDSRKQDTMTPLPPSSDSYVPGTYSLPGQVRDEIATRISGVRRDVGIFLPLGAIMYWCGDELPDVTRYRWHKCDGTLIDNLPNVSYESKMKLKEILNDTKLPIADNAIILCAQFSL